MRLTKETFGGSAAAAHEGDNIHDINIVVEEEVGITCGSEDDCRINDWDDDQVARPPQVQVRGPPV